jgi:hypothetical protein
MADEFTKAALYWIKTFNKKAKEKIWMMKLIELLNEFETPQSWVVFKSYDDYDGTFYWVDIDGETEIAWSDSYICGKRFQWVKWLVENDKIDKENVYNNSDYPMVKRDEFLYEWLLMLLAIQDEPIRFLCEILK